MYLGIACYTHPFSMRLMKRIQKHQVLQFIVYNVTIIVALVTYKFILEVVIILLFKDDFNLYFLACGATGYVPWAWATLPLQEREVGGKRHAETRTGSNVHDSNSLKRLKGSLSL